MTAAQYLMLAAAVLCAASWRWNATAAALAFAYFAVQVWWLTGGPLDVGFLFMIDIFTITLIFCKAAARCPDQEFSNGWEHLACMAQAPTRYDRVILAIFPVIWISYVLTIDWHARWWALWLASMIQFLIAGREAYSEWRKAKALFDEPDLPSSGMLFAVARAGRWST